MSFVQSPLAQFLASLTGRLARIVAGVVLIALGALLITGVWGWIVALIGLVPLAAGLLDVCLIVGLFGGPIGGRAIRTAGHSHS